MSVGVANKIADGRAQYEAIASAGEDAIYKALVRSMLVASDPIQLYRFGVSCVISLPEHWNQSGSYRDRLNARFEAEHGVGLSSLWVEYVGYPWFSCVCGGQPRWRIAAKFRECVTQR